MPLTVKSKMRFPTSQLGWYVSAKPRLILFMESGSNP